jgi:hypothetical protein
LNGGAEALRKRLLEVIRRGVAAPLPEDEFDELALALFRHQFDCNPPFRAYCSARGASPRTVGRWSDIPAVPADAFKAATLLCGDPREAEVTFRTSGTTAGEGRRGTHMMLDSMLYRAALRASFQFHLLPDHARIPIFSMVPPARDVPDSSLSFMISDVQATFGEPDSAFFVEAQAVRTEALVQALRGAENRDEPVLIVGTSFAFVHLLDVLATARLSLRLPQGSRVMDTGGFKGRAREVSRKELYESIADRLGIPDSFVVNEYGMTEMSSQLYDSVAGQGVSSGEGRLHRGPPWVRTVAVDPETLELLPAGELGVLRHLDLANMDSVVALQTADLGVATPAGIQLQGRASGAEARGCSLAMEELLEAIGKGEGG